MRFNFWVKRFRKLLWLVDVKFKDLTNSYVWWINSIIFQTYKCIKIRNWFRSLADSIRWTCLIAKDNYGKLPIQWKPNWLEKGIIFFRQPKTTRERLYRPIEINADFCPILNWPFQQCFDFAITNFDFKCFLLTSPGPSLIRINSRPNEIPIEKSCSQCTVHSTCL